MQFNANMYFGGFFMVNKIVVLSASPYSMTDDKTGLINEGVSFHYIISSDLKPNVDGKFLGYRVAKGSLPLDSLSQFSSVPALFDCEFAIKPNAQGKALLVPSKLSFLKALA
jgi:hypothetical protein